MTARALLLAWTLLPAEPFSGPSRCRSKTSLCLSGVHKTGIWTVAKLQPCSGQRLDHQAGLGRLISLSAMPRQHSLSALMVHPGLSRPRSLAEQCSVCQDSLAQLPRTGQCRAARVLVGLWDQPVMLLQEQEGLEMLVLLPGPTTADTALEDISGSCWRGRIWHLARGQALGLWELSVEALIIREVIGN